MLIKLPSLNYRSILALLVVSTLLFNLTSTVKSEPTEFSYQGSDPCEFIDDLSFNASAANASITWQTNLGPRLPGSNASASLRASITENLSASWSFSENSHEREDFTLTNLVGTFTPENSTGQNVVIVAHYDSRHIAERDENVSMRDHPIDGANDGASGVAVMIELGKIIPTMNLSHDVTLMFSDAEDQGKRGYANTWSYGATAWVENLTSEYISNITAYIVIDMIGDAFLDFTKLDRTSEHLWDTVIPITAALGMMETHADCSGNYGQSIFDSTEYRDVIDDHIPAHNAGIPAINFIDINFGENASDFGGYWHTHQDTADKVSAESLGLIGNLLEIGLKSSAWTAESITVVDGSQAQENQPTTSVEVEEAAVEIEKSRIVGYISIVIVGMVLILILMADISLKL
tara:strand:+ start:5822 stop:7036 length:1215 start_codon:yes stop_codon:yes gene_type:complete